VTNVVWVGWNGAETRESKKISSEDIGPKAGGLLSIPLAWTLPFLVVCPKIFEDFRGTKGTHRKQTVEKWAKHIRHGLALLELDSKVALILRSNASREGLRDRGSLTSCVSSLKSLKSDLNGLLGAMSSIAGDRSIGLIVQQYVEPIVRGHLSNERRLREERRDGIIQFENVSTGEMTDVGIGFRRWRHGAPPSDQALLCRHESEIKTVLHEMLKFAATKKQRMHFEWLWSGSAVYVVQADHDTEIATGERPDSLVDQPTEDLDTESLQVFRRAEEADRTIASKLDNHFRFQVAGFWQPTFYVLDNKNALRSISSGTVSDALRNDLKRLTESFLVIRSSCIGKQVHLLPRSHLLSSVDEAVDWLTSTFVSELASKSLLTEDVMLICHRYVQAVASAFSMGSADRQDVLIEAAWGIPEGLYYYPCDTYHVNTLTRDVEGITDDYSRFTMSTLGKGPKRYQVFPERESGKFVRYEVAIPFDWKQTIGDQDILSMMAAYTRQLAAELGYPINLMWFVDCRTPDGQKAAIPWYAEELVKPKIESYRQNRKDTIVEICTEADLKELENHYIEQSANASAGQLVIELNPTENVALRDTKFAERVGQAAAGCKGIVILNGAMLSHIYYVLERSGATVCSRSASRVTADREFHQKLVRDKIPDVVRSRGETVRFGTLNKLEKQAALRVKLLEEAFEAKDASSDELLGELADVLEVVRALARASDYSMSDVEEERRKKEDTRGSFDDGIVLIETSSISSSEEPGSEVVQKDLMPDAPESSFSPKIQIDAIDHGWKDVREGSDYLELIESASVPLSYREWTLESKGTDLPLLKSDRPRLTWKVLGRREGSKLKLKVRIQLGTRQMTLDLKAAD